MFTNLLLIFEAAARFKELMNTKISDLEARADNMSPEELRAELAELRLLQDTHFHNQEQDQRLDLMLQILRDG